MAQRLIVGIYAGGTSDPKPLEDALASQKIDAPSGAGPVQASFVPASSEDPLDNVQINVEAREKVWISITSDGKQIFSGILQPSQSKTLSGREFAKVSVGNAGGLEIRWNGKAIGPIGKRGQVRTLKFTKDNFEILPPLTQQVGQTL